MRSLIALKTDHDFGCINQGELVLLPYSIYYFHFESQQDDDWRLKLAEKEGEGYLVIPQEDLRTSQCTILPYAGSMQPRCGEMGEQRHRLPRAR